MEIKKYSHIGELIAAARIERGLSQLSLSELVGVSQNYISRIEHGKHEIRASLLQKIAKSLDLQVQLYGYKSDSCYIVEE